MTMTEFKFLSNKYRDRIKNLFESAWENNNIKKIWAICNITGKTSMVDVVKKILDDFNVDFRSIAYDEKWIIYRRERPYLEIRCDIDISKYISKFSDDKKKELWSDLVFKFSGDVSDSIIISMNINKVVVILQSEYLAHCIRFYVEKSEKMFFDLMKILYEYSKVIDDVEEEIRLYFSKGDSG